MFKTTNVQGKEELDLGSISVFICSILLSLGGFIAILASACRRSRCTELGGCCGITCIRDPVDEVDVAI